MAIIFWLCFVFILETETNQSSKDRDVEKFYIHCYWLPLFCVQIYKRGIKCDPPVTLRKTLSNCFTFVEVISRSDISSELKLVPRKSTFLEMVLLIFIMYKPSSNIKDLIIKIPHFNHKPTL